MKMRAIHVLTVEDFEEDFKEAEAVFRKKAITPEMEKVFVKLYPTYGGRPFADAWGLPLHRFTGLAQRMRIKGPGSRPIAAPSGLVEKLRLLKG